MIDPHRNSKTATLLGDSSEIPRSLERECRRLGSPYSAGLRSSEAREKMLYWYPSSSNSSRAANNHQELPANIAYDGHSETFHRNVRTIQQATTSNTGGKLSFKSNRSPQNELSQSYRLGQSVIITGFSVFSQANHIMNRKPHFGGGGPPPLLPIHLGLA